jgi:transposase-like protein
MRPPPLKCAKNILRYHCNVFTVVPTKYMCPVADMRKAIHAAEDREAAQDEANAVIEKPRTMRLKEAAQRVRDGIAETLTYHTFRPPIGGVSGPTIRWNGSCVRYDGVRAWWAPFQMLI